MSSFSVRTSTHVPQHAAYRISKHCDILNILNMGVILYLFARVQGPNAHKGPNALFRHPVVNSPSRVCSLVGALALHQCHLCAWRSYHIEKNFMHR
jgi:hypothetical protein